MSLEYIKNYWRVFEKLWQSVQATDLAKQPLELSHAVAQVGRLIKTRGAAGGRLMFIGNGASAAISSHMAADFSKNSGVPASCFNDAALLTCLSNDFSYQEVFEKAVSIYARAGDILVAISSSGRSENVLRGVAKARELDCQVLTLSGFKPDNPLRGSGDFNFYVPEQNYGPVEVLHHGICHCLLDNIVNNPEL